MNDSEIVKVRIRERPIIGESLKITDIISITGASPELISRIIEEEIVLPSRVDAEGSWFDRNTIAIIERALRLHDELGVNLSGIAIITRLLDRIEVTSHLIALGSGGEDIREAESE